MFAAHPAYIALALSGMGVLLILVGVLTALKPASRLARHAGAIADEAIFLQIASLQMQFERLSHVGPEVEPLALRARSAITAIRAGVADLRLDEITQGVRTSNRAIRDIISTFR